MKGVLEQVVEAEMRVFEKRYAVYTSMIPFGLEQSTHQRMHQDGKTCFHAKSEEI